MNQSQNTNIAITFSSKKGLRIISKTNDEIIQKTEKNPVFKVYTNTPIVDDRNTIALCNKINPETLQSTKTTLNDLKNKVSPNTYLNFASYDAKNLAGNRTFLNKIIIDRDLDFYPELADIRLVYFNFIHVQKLLNSIALFDV